MYDGEIWGLLKALNFVVTINFNHIDCKIISDKINLAYSIMIELRNIIVKCYMILVNYLFYEIWFV